VTLPDDYRRRFVETGKLINYQFAVSQTSRSHLSRMRRIKGLHIEDLDLILHIMFVICL
jgi:hypothetical protein